ncbi:MAG TPA: carbohydrate ABC transporter permease [Polyangiaceae bacterium]|nr:carbohydrate ABC transporter permease [Polyangiaceae bacterium]
MSAAGSPFSSTFRRHPRARVLVHLALITACLIFVFPMLWMVSTSLKPIHETMRSPPAWLPETFEWRNYLETVRYIPFWEYTKNTLVICTLSSIGTTFSSALVAYSFTRLEWPGRDLLFALTLATMMVPFPVLMVPLYGVFRELGWIGTLYPLWVPSFFGGAFNIFLLRQFFLRIPKALPEAMMLDGASELTIFFRTYVPLSKSSLAVVAFFQFVYSWNDLLGPLLYLTDQNTFTLSLGLQFYESQIGGTQWHYLMAASVLTTLPVVVLFFFVQRAFLRGLGSMQNVDA